MGQNVGVKIPGPELKDEKSGFKLGILCKESGGFLHLKTNLSKFLNSSLV